MKINSKIAAVFLAALIVTATYCDAFAEAPDPLPPTAQEALNKGILAAKMPDYLLAIRFFEEARKAAPEAPVIYLNMGLAESRIPGRELRAIAWFGAYLSAYPEAPNAAAVKEQIEALDVRNQSNVSRLIKSVQDASLQIPLPDYERDNLLSPGVVELWAMSGDVPAALNLADRLKDDDNKSYARYAIAKIQAESGDFKGAQQTTMLINNAFDLVSARADITKALINAGDIPGARKCLASTQESATMLVKEYEQERAQTLIAQTQEALAIATKDGNLTRQSDSNAQPAITVADWLSELGIRLYGPYRGIYPKDLNQELFLDFPGYLLSLKATLPSKIAHDHLQDEIYRNGEAKIYFDDIYEAAKTIVSKEIVIQQMVRREVRK